jgi:murein DD-endopeptidase MepM/ murein hydrolase activator NlpD
LGDQTTRSARLRVLLITVVALAAFAAFLWVRGKRGGFANDTISFSKIDQANSSDLLTPQPASGPSISPAPSPAPPVGSATSTPAQTPGPLNAQSTPPPLENNQAAAKDAALAGSFVGTLKLIIPVVGVRPDQLLDTFTDARSEGRVHDALDIPAPAATPVVAAADGEIIKLFQSERGGTTIYQLSPDKKLVFYYAHLQRYADGLAPGKFVKQGEVIAYVGDTGNAGVGNFHLHFSISVVADPRRYWEGTNINPYPLLHK